MDFNKLRKYQIQSELTNRGISSVGNKSELLNRLKTAPPKSDTSNNGSDLVSNSNIALTAGKMVSVTNTLSMVVTGPFSGENINADNQQPKLISSAVYDPNQNTFTTAKKRKRLSTTQTSKDEGTNLELKQMDELIKLFQMVKTNPKLWSLLNSDEQNILQTFLPMENNRKYVLIELFVRKRWYNIFNLPTKTNLKLGDDHNILQIYKDLVKENDFVDTVDKFPLSEDLIDNLDDGRIKEIMKNCKIKTTRSKKANIKALLASEKAKMSIKKEMEHRIKINDTASNTFNNAYLLATFTNDDFYNMKYYFASVINGKVDFPKSTIEDYLVFSSEATFLSYRNALKMKLEQEQLKDKITEINGIGERAFNILNGLKDTDDHSEARYLTTFTAQNVYINILSSCCDKIYTIQNKQTRKSKEPNDLKKWLVYLKKTFKNSPRWGEWCRILIRLHMRNLQYEEAIDILLNDVFVSKTSELDEIDDFNLRELSQTLKSMRSKITESSYHRLTRIPPNSINLDFPSSTVSFKGEMTPEEVDTLIFKHYADKECYDGVTQRITALLLLFFWDIIYEPTKTIPGAYISALQKAPLDMFTSYFYTNRKELIDQRLKDIESGWLEETLISFAVCNWQSHRHEKAAFGIIVNVIKDEPTVKVLITVIGRSILFKIFKRLIKNLRAFKSGMPDLLVWNVNKKKCKFVKVWNVNDILSTSTAQNLWLNYLRESGASVEVCMVENKELKHKKISREHEQNEALSFTAGPSTTGPSTAGPSSRLDD